MGEKIDPQRAVKLTLALKKILEKGDIGELAKARDNPLIPGEVVDLVWQIIFGKSREESIDERGATFVLAMYGKQPLLGWHLSKLPVNEIITLLATTVGLVGQRVGRSIIDEMIQALTMLKERQQLEDATDGQTPN